VVEAPAERESVASSRFALVQERKRKYAARSRSPSDHSRTTIHVPMRGPIGLLVIGDPHVDDDGTDLELLERHMRLIRDTEGAYAACVGDVTNNWVGRLARLYGEQSTSAAEAWELAEWFFDEIGQKLLWLVAGNHDMWSGAGDPLKWVSRHNHTVYEPWDIVVTLKTPETGDKPFTINMKHSFKGNSQWNTCHAIAKAAQLGTRYDLLTSGHTHVSGYQIVKDEQTGQLIHCLQVASYKIHDRYAKEMGLKDKSISPGAFVIFTPGASAAGRVMVFHDIELGARVLTAMRDGDVV
jgi:predicted phosphodiesterase